ncbi:MAG TPA: PAS domain S-box protein [Vicinamibacteria bacterium]|nr:PAS domain S-box protein [Vicinamibacteria bacterium]
MPSPLADPAFRALFEDAPIGIVIVDEPLRIVDINAAYCEMLGYTEAEMMKRTIYDVTHPDDRARDREFAALLFAGTLPRYKAQKRYIRKDGEVVKARIVVTPLVEASRDIRYLFSMAMEISG